MYDEPQAITAERERWTAVQWEVEEARVAQQAAEDEAERERGMRQELSEKLDGVLGRFRQRGVLTEPMIKDGLREIRRVLLEADVNYQLARDFLARVEERALGERVLRSISPGQQIVKIVHDELVALLGGSRAALQLAPLLLEPR